MTFEKDPRILELQLTQLACHITYENALALREKRFETINAFYEMSKHADDNLILNSVYRFFKYITNKRFENENKICLENIVEFEKAKKLFETVDGPQKAEYDLYIKTISKKISETQKVYDSMIHRKIVDD
jgi:hypothetical protein